MMPAVPTDAVRSIAEARFEDLTEVAGEEVSSEQIERMVRRYRWAASRCNDGDVLEVAAGTAQGAGMLAASAHSLAVGDTSTTLLSLAAGHYRGRIALQRFDATRLPFMDASFDRVVILEAIYYLPDVSRFFQECRRVLRTSGAILIATANKDLFDFNPSPRSHRYLGTVELGSELEAHGFDVELFGDTPVDRVSVRQRVLRPVKAAAARLGLIPSTMHGKKLLKRLVFGGLVPMPAEITTEMAEDVAPTPLPPGVADRRHKVLFCAATLR